MTHVVSFAIIIGHESHEIVCSNVIGVLFHVLFHAVPESDNSFAILVQRNNKAILLLLSAHKGERILRYVTEVLNARLNSPIVVVGFQQVMAEEEAGFETTHVAVTSRAAINHILHVVARLCSLVLVNPLGIAPMFLGYFAILSFAGDQGLCNLFKLIIEIVVVEKDPVVVILVVEAVFYLMN